MKKRLKLLWTIGCLRDCPKFRALIPFRLHIVNIHGFDNQKGPDEVLVIVHSIDY